MNYAYIRVSTESQTVENQRIVISDYAKKIGRAVGEKPTMFKLTPYKKEIQKGLKEGRTINSLARQFKVRWPTMKSFVTVNMFIKPKRRSFKRECEKELTSEKLRYKLKEWIFKKF